jgi:hypothetical protein
VIPTKFLSPSMKEQFLMIDSTEREVLFFGSGITFKNDIFDDFKIQSAGPRHCVVRLVDLGAEMERMWRFSLKMLELEYRPCSYCLTKIGASRKTHISFWSCPSYPYRCSLITILLPSVESKSSKLQSCAFPFHLFSHELIPTSKFSSRQMSRSRLQIFQFPSLQLLISHSCVSVCQYLPLRVRPTSRGWFHDHLLEPSFSLYLLSSCDPTTLRGIR